MRPTRAQSCRMRAITQETGQEEDRIRRSLEQAADGRTHRLAEVHARHDALEDTYSPHILTQPPTKRCDPEKAELLRQFDDPGIRVEDLQRLIAQVEPVELRTQLAAAAFLALRARWKAAEKDARGTCAMVAMRLSRRRHLAGDEAGADAARQLAKFLREGEHLVEEAP